MSAIISVRGKEAEAFKAIAPFVRDGIDRPAAIAALLRIPAEHWPKEEAKPLLDSLRAYVRNVPTQDRTSPEALDTLQLCYTLASLLPASKAAAVNPIVALQDE